MLYIHSNTHSVHYTLSLHVALPILSLLHRFRRTDFIPAPSVDAVFVRLHKRGPPLVAEIEAQLYRDLVAACFAAWRPSKSEEHTSELQSLAYLVCRLLLEKKNYT